VQTRRDLFDTGGKGTIGKITPGSCFLAAKSRFQRVPAEAFPKKSVDCGHKEANSWRKVVQINVLTPLAVVTPQRRNWPFLLQAPVRGLMILYHLGKHGIRSIMRQSAYYPKRRHVRIIFFI